MWQAKGTRPVLDTWCSEPCTGVILVIRRAAFFGFE